MHDVISNRRLLLATLPLLLVACATDGRVDHRVHVRNVGKAEVVAFSYTYGSLGRRETPRLGLGGDSVTMPMRIPEVVNVNWTNENNGARHSVAIPLQSKLSMAQASGRTVRFDIDGDTLCVYLITRQPAFQEQSERIFSYKNGVVEQ